MLCDLFDETLSFSNQKYLQSMVKRKMDIVTRGWRKLRNIFHNSNKKMGWVAQVESKNRLEIHAQIYSREN
jgi:hypothetical protein